MGKPKYCGDYNKPVTGNRGFVAIRGLPQNYWERLDGAVDLEFQ
jgi:hypothetical protein